MDITLLPAEPIIFVATRFASDQRCLATIVSSHRGIEVGFWETSWTREVLYYASVELTCGTLATTRQERPGGIPQRTSDSDQVAWDWDIMDSGNYGFLPEE